LHRFYKNLDGISPVGQLTRDSHGNLFGVTSLGGGASPAGQGMVFELQPTSAGIWMETIIHDFAGGTDGSFPQAGVVVDSLGHLYGTTQWGGTGTMCQDGSGYCGTVYEITP
jgi:hypothetical protein